MGPIFFVSLANYNKLIEIKKALVCKTKKNSTKVEPLGNNQDITVRSLTSGYSHPHEDLVRCGCPQRTVVPDKPKTLPFDPIPENNEKMKNWLLERYASSTFNTCPRRALPCMSGPPMDIHIDESAKPKACHKPAPVWCRCTGSNKFTKTSLGMRRWGL